MPGLGAAELERLSGPAGLDLGGSTVGEAALAILAEAVALRNGRAGARLTTLRERDPRRRAPVICGLVLAAGAGTRFGDEPKQLAELDGRPLLEWAVRAQCDAPALERVVVVLGSGAARIRDAVDFGRAEVDRLPGLGRRPVGVAAIRPGARWPTRTRSSSRSATRR